VLSSLAKHLSIPVSYASEASVPWDAFSGIGSVWSSDAETIHDFGMVLSLNDISFLCQLPRIARHRSSLIAFLVSVTV